LTHDGIFLKAVVNSGESAFRSLSKQWLTTCDADTRFKAVLPVLTGNRYVKLESQESGQAIIEFLRIHFGDVSEAERQKVRRQLERYCGQDTEGMIWTVDAMRKFAPQL